MSYRVDSFRQMIHDTLLPDLLFRYKTGLNPSGLLQFRQPGTDRYGIRLIIGKKKDLKRRNHEFQQVHNQGAGGGTGSD
jgi:hypothetical protein